MSSPGPAPSKGSGNFVRQLALAMELPFVMIGGVVIGGGIGYLMDRSAHTSPLLTLLGGLLGFGAGIGDIIRRLLRDEKHGSGNGSNGGGDSHGGR
jgi:F0F1-type ATP synthase assembly protein I